MITGADYSKPLSSDARSQGNRISGMPVIFVTYLVLDVIKSKVHGKSRGNLKPSCAAQLPTILA